MSLVGIPIIIVTNIIHIGLYASSSSWLPIPAFTHNVTILMDRVLEINFLLFNNRQLVGLYCLLNDH